MGGFNRQGPWHHGILRDFSQQQDYMRIRSRPIFLLSLFYCNFRLIYYVIFISFSSYYHTNLKFPRLKTTECASGADVRPSARESDVWDSRACKVEERTVGGSRDEREPLPATNYKVSKTSGN